MTYTYDAIGNRTQRVDPSGTTTYTFDRLNWLTREALPGGVTYTSA
jgi:YD repeat-containing protein